MSEQSSSRVHKHPKVETDFKPRVLVLISDEDEDPEFSISRYCVIEGEKDGALNHFRSFVTT